VCSSDLEVLAAAYAEAGNFEHAIEWQQKGLNQSAPETKAKWEARLELYRTGQPFRETPLIKAQLASQMEASGKI